MKRTFAFLLTALMAMSLTACGTDKNNTPNNSTPNQSVTDNNAGSGAGSATGTAAVKNSDQRRIENGASGTAAGAADNEMLGLENDGVGAPESAVVNNGNRTNSGVIRSTTYGQMLRNARVHDRDGFLLDGENAVTPGAAFR
ncbi:hypothetical protein SDC9_75508 [bioreactor metagenome]|uniref:Lipoprotein n=1 Tax=bioreactor metagenome TaxID=1076179 RepID=A0A644YKR4_9ZZZZ|nr:hypothetical protein [Oscillibacter sp.]MEA4992667.1 hypothetical protein [Oscillibacter sp.]